MKDNKFYKQVLNAANANGVGNNIDVQDYENVVIDIWFNAATLTIKVMGSISDDSPNFASAQSKTNMFEYVQTVDAQNNTVIVGKTGIAQAGATSGARMLELNLNGLKWLNFEVSGYSAGDVTVNVRGFNNQ